MPSNVDALSRLHAPASSSALPSLLSSAPRIHVDSSILAMLVNEKVANGSAPGFSDWTGEHLQALVGDSDCMAGIVAIVEEIVNGDFAEDARVLLLSSSLIASEKEAGGLRPIA